MHCTHGVNRTGYMICRYAMSCNLYGLLCTVAVSSLHDIFLKHAKKFQWPILEFTAFARLCGLLAKETKIGLTL